MCNNKPTNEQENVHRPGRPGRWPNAMLWQCRAAAAPRPEDGEHGETGSPRGVRPGSAPLPEPGPLVGLLAAGSGSGRPPVRRKPWAGVLPGAGRGMQSTNGRSLGDARGCSPPTSNTQPLSQLGQHPVDSGDPAGPGAADTQGDRQQQRAKADAEHQRWFPVAENPHPAHGRGEAQQGGHPPADGGVHLLPGAGEDPATAAEHPAQAVHPGVQRLLPEAATGGGQRRGHRLAGHLGGREGRGPAAGDDRAPAAAGQGALGPHDAGGAGSLPGGPHVPREAEGDCSASAAPAAAGAGEVAAPGEARARAADPNPAPASTRSPSAHPPPHCDRTSTASLPSRHRGHHGPVLGHQHSLHVPAKPGHHRSGDPAHRGDAGEAAAGRGAAACRHRDARARLPRALRLRHRLRHGGQRQ
uniref:Uncharacterized protein n=1 Tax=Anser cygnoides TaxID=8845 RepID=A0A8B9DGY2_ANSCY